MTENKYKCDICRISPVISPYEIATYHFGVGVTREVLGRIYSTGDTAHLCPHHAHELYEQAYKENNDYLKWYR
jgi:hypothetical protein